MNFLIYRKKNEYQINSVIGIPIINANVHDIKVEKQASNAKFKTTIGKNGNWMMKENEGSK
jgi:hypothetical protein